MQCPNCNKDLSEGTRTCPECGGSMHGMDRVSFTGNDSADLTIGLVLGFMFSSIVCPVFIGSFLTLLLGLLIQQKRRSFASGLYVGAALGFFGAMGVCYVAINHGLRAR